MNKLIILIIALFLINHCSFNENSRIWKEKEKKLQNKSQIKKVFSEDKKIVKEFNPKLKLKLENVITNNKIIEVLIRVYSIVMKVAIFNIRNIFVTSTMGVAYKVKLGKNF